MKYKYTILFLLFFSISSYVEKLEIESYKSVTLKNPKKEIPLASGLSFFKSNAYGITRYYSVADKINSNSSNPTETPLIAILKEKREKLSVERYLSINNKDYPKIKLDKLDLEAITSAPNDTLWVADENSLNLLQVSTINGNILKVIKPSEKTLKVFKHKIDGRGFEGLTLFPNGKLLVALQTPLKDKYSKINNETFIPFYLYDLNSKEEKILAYVVENLKNETVKIGGLQAIDKNRFLLVERFEEENKVNIKIFNFNNIEKFSDNFNDNPVYKFKKHDIELSIDVNKLNSSKIEGVTLLEGGRDIVLINDGDGADVELTTVSLNQGLIDWGFKEYFISALLFLILLASLVFTYRVLRK